jgi:hypothetical protein
MNSKSRISIAVRRREAAIADFYDCLDRAEPWPTIHEILVEIMPEVFAGSVSLFPGQMSFYRIRKNYGVDVFHEVADLFYPPAQSCKSFGRCNRQHAPLLYTSLNPITPLFEVGEMHTGEVFTMISYVIRAGISLTVATIGIEVPAEKSDFSATEERKRALARTNEFLNALFTLTRTDEKYYKLTNEIIDTYFDFPGNSGFLYPSIRRSESPDAYENLAIKPEVVDNKLGIDAINVFRVTKTDGQGRLIAAERILAFTEVVDGRVNYARPREDKVLTLPGDMDLKKATLQLQGRQKLHYLDLLSSGVTANQLGGSDRDPNYVEVVCPECGHRHFQHSSSDLVRVFQILAISDVPFIGPGHECPKCGRRSSWDRWKKSSEAAT